MHPPERDRLAEQLADNLSLAYRRSVKRPLSLNLIRQPRRKPNPKLHLPNVRLTRQSLSLQPRNPNR
jgi:hypothetical protein